MTRYHKALGMFLITLFGLWGCSRVPSGGDKSSLEARIHKVEEELKAASAARDQNRKKLLEAEQLAANLQREVERLQLVAKERDELAVERDQLQTQYDTFRRNIKDLLGQAETSLKATKTGVASAELISGPGGGN